jgi:hypothetical protein
MMRLRPTRGGTTGQDHPDDEGRQRGKHDQCADPAGRSHCRDHQKRNHPDRPAQGQETGDKAFARRHRFHGQMHVFADQASARASRGQQGRKQMLTPGRLGPRRSGLPGQGRAGLCQRTPERTGQKQHANHGKGRVGCDKRRQTLIEGKAEAERDGYGAEAFCHPPQRGPSIGARTKGRRHGTLDHILKPLIVNCYL